jgi:hypothetical protein
VMFEAIPTNHKEEWGEIRNHYMYDFSKSWIGDNEEDEKG